MVGKITGISRDLIIHPGETIADILADRNISQAELAAQTGVSAAYISSIISGKKGISPKFAMALEYALNVPKSFWLNLQANYEAELLDLNETETVTEEEQKIFNELKEVAKYLKINVKQSIEQKILDLRKALRVSSLTNLQRILPSGAFRTSTKVTVNPTVVGALGLTAGFCGTLLTPMAANFNIVPASILEMKNKNGVISKQVGVAVPLLAIHIVLMYFLAF